MTGLDADTESEVARALDRLTAGRTTFVITHDLEAAGTATRWSGSSGARSLGAGIPTRCWAVRPSGAC